jgi:hypothetical protein
MTDATGAHAKWKRLFPKWSRQFLVHPADPKSGTRLDSKWAQGLAVGCKCCSAAGIQTPFGTYNVASTAALQVVNFNKHTANARHVAAAAAFRSGIPDMAVYCPGIDEFKQAAQSIAVGGPLGGWVHHRIP